MNFCAHQQNAGTVSDQVIQTQKPCCSRESAPQADVGADRHDRTLPHCGDDEAFADRLSVATVEAELDRAVSELFAASQHAYEVDGDPAGARLYMERAEALIASRTDEHQQRLHAKAWQRMLDEDACYFSAAGERDGEAMK
jgi:hypothetical protein